MTQPAAAKDESDISFWRECPRLAVAFGFLIRRAVAASMDHDVLTVAQATAYAAVVALFPTLIVAAAFVGFLPDTQPMRVQLAVFFARILPSNVSPVLATYFVSTHKNPQTAAALWSAAAVSLTGAVSVMATLMEGFRRAHHLPLPRGSFWPRRFRALVLVPLSLVPLTFATLLVVFGHYISSWVAGAVPGALRLPVYVIAFVSRWFVALAGSTAIIAVIYHLGTDLKKHLSGELKPMLRDPRLPFRKDWTWHASLPGAALATLMWFVSTLLFGLYVTHYANYSRFYGSLGAAIALMVWLYLIAVCILFGAEFNAQTAARRRVLAKIAVEEAPPSPLPAGRMAD